MTDTRWIEVKDCTYLIGNFMQLGMHNKTIELCNPPGKQGHGNN